MNAGETQSPLSQKPWVAMRYQLLDEVTEGRLFRAHDTKSGRVVAVRLLESTLLASAEMRRELSETFAQLQGGPALPGVVTYLALDLSKGLLVREWVNGFSLMELLRRRRQLSVEETIRLLEGVPELLDAATSRELVIPPDLLTKLLVAFPENEAADAVDERKNDPLGDWPPFTLKLNPLRIVDPKSSSVEVATRQREQPTTDQQPVAILAALLYELLGGPHRTGARRFDTPLSAINEEANLLLRRTASGPAFADAATFWRDFTKASGVEIERFTCRIPETLLASAQRGQALKLSPVKGSRPPIHLIARPQFRLGRSQRRADFVARLLPECPANEKLTSEISRIHVTAEIAEGIPVLRDGDGARPSVNGATWNGQPISATNARTLTPPGVLALSEHYDVEALALRNPSRQAPEIANLDSWSGHASIPPAPPIPPGLPSAIIFRPLRGQTPVREAVWVFSEVPFVLEVSGDLRWHSGAPGPRSGSFFFLHGAFWLANKTLPKDQLVVGSTPLAPGEIAPLAHSQTVTIGGVGFTTTVE